jgi:FkbM family methyltransferase
MIGPLAGLRMFLDSSDSFQAEMACGVYQPDLVQALSRLVRPDDTVLTAGAHVGYLALVLGRLVGPSGRVIACECDPYLVERCRYNLSLNDLPVTLLPVALGSENADRQMFISSTPGQSSFSIPHHSSEKQTIAVRRGDEVLREIGVERLDGLVLDVEGWEPYVLKGLNKRPRWAIVECFDHALRDAGSSGEQLRSQLKSYGFTIKQMGGDLICT